MKDNSKTADKKASGKQKKEGKLLNDKEQKKLKDELLQSGEASTKPQFHHLPDDDADKPLPIMLKK